MLSFLRKLFFGREPEAPQSPEVSERPSKDDSSQTLKVDKDFHRYIIGTQGATIKRIQSSTGAHIQVPKDGADLVTLTGSPQAIKQAKAEIMAIIDEQEARKQAIVTPEQADEQTSRNEKAYQAAKKKVDQHAELRQKYSEEADKAYKSGDKAKARELREKAKAETGKMEAAQEQAARKVFAQVNKGRGIAVIDLHGQQVKYALALLEERLTELRSKHKGVKELSVITGAGNHSGKDGPKVKPAVENYFNEQGVTFKPGKSGELIVTLP